MSLILDALKRAERERKLGQTPAALDEVAPPPPPPPGKPNRRRFSVVPADHLIAMAFFLHGHHQRKIANRPNHGRRCHWQDCTGSTPGQCDVGLIGSCIDGQIQPVQCVAQLVVQGAQGPVTGPEHGAVAVYATGNHQAFAAYGAKKGGEVLRLTAQLRR